MHKQHLKFFISKVTFKLVINILFWHLGCWGKACITVRMKRCFWVIRTTRNERQKVHICSLQFLQLFRFCFRKIWDPCVSCLSYVVIFFFSFSFPNRMLWKKMNSRKNKRKQWEKSYWLRRLNSMTPRYRTSWAEWNLCSVYSKLKKELVESQKAQISRPRRRSRHRRRGISSRSWSQSCESGKPKTIDRCMRARTAPSRTSSQVGQKEKLKGPMWASAAAPVFPGWGWPWSSTAQLLWSALCATFCKHPHIWSTAAYSSNYWLLYDAPPGLQWNLQHWSIFPSDRQFKASYARN